MKHKFLGIFGKVFFYTVLILLFVIFVMFAFFSDQIKSVVESTHKQQLTDIFQPLLLQVNEKSDDEIVKIAERFHQKNVAFEFCFEASDGRILYQTRGFTMPQKNDKAHPPNNVLIKGAPLPDSKFNFFLAKGTGERFQFVTLVSNGVKLYISGTISEASVYSEFIEKAVFAFALIFMASVLAAAVFAGQIANPIKKIAVNARKMSDLEPVSAPAPRKDEIGQLAADVYKMYKTLKSTICQLESEIEREKEMEENQRYFFSAASHELKTPIAATSAILEGMLENVIEPLEYPKYLRECLKMMNEQNKLVSEILNIVALNNDTIGQEQGRINLNECISGVLAACRTLADIKEQRIDVDIPKKLFCTFDSKLFGNAFSNVVMNAVQNTPEGGRIHIYTVESHKGVRLCVLNEGVSIPEEILPKLFEPFYRADKARSRGQGHSGLGLTIVKKTLHLMKIPFALENSNDGVLFWMDLPY